MAWDDPTEAIPAFLTVIMMPLSVSITEGVAFGVIAYVVLKVAAGRRRDVHRLAVRLRRALRRTIRLLCADAAPPVAALASNMKML